MNHNATGIQQVRSTIEKYRSLLFFISLLIGPVSFSQVKSTVTPIEYEEIPVTVFIENVGKFDLNILYVSDEEIYIPIQQLFYPLSIACEFGLNNNILQGFIERESRAYKIDFNNKLITIDTKTIAAEQALIQEMGTLYLESFKFKDVFGIDLAFNFRSLSIKLKANFELPIVKQARLKKMQQNVAKVKGEEPKADTIIKRASHLLKLGALDWNLSSYQDWQGKTSNTIGLGFGTELLYGEANINFNYNDQYTFDNRQINYLWRWIDNDKTLIRQAQVGKIAVQSIASLNAPLIGATVRNSPTTVRKASGSYTINEITEPNWNVELYINNVLVDFTTADASGNFIFKVPIVYGYTTLTLKYYGPMGEERMDERVLNVPYTVMPVNEFEYGLTTGVVQDSTYARYGKGEFFYGLSRKLTFGGGVEYFSKITDGSVIPFAKATFQPFSKLTLNAEYAHGVKSRGLLNYYISRDILLEVDYANYVTNQKATLFNASEELKAKLSIPYRYHQLNGYLKLDYSKLMYTSFDYNYAYLMLSTNYKKINANTSAQLNWVDQQAPYVVNDFSLSYRFINNLVIRPSIKYNLTKNTLISYRAELEKSSYIGHFSISYERNNLAKDHTVNISFKYDLSFARVNAVASYRQKNFSTSQNAQGSIAFDTENKYAHFSKNSSMGKGGLAVYPFLDMNQNGVLDKGEPLVKLSNLKISGGKPIFSKKDTIIRIPDLNAFTNYTITFSDADLESISWRFKHKTYQVLIDPNQFKRIDVPIQIMGEMSGMVYKEHQNTLKGISRITLKIYAKDSDQLVAETLSESDGYLYYLGLKPGDYKACIDPDQLNNLDLKATPSCRYFTIKSTLEGDIVDGLDFTLSKENSDHQNIQEHKTEDLINSQPLTDKASDENTESTEVNTVNILYTLQLMASRKPVKINDYFSQLLSKIPTLQIEETLSKSGWYRYHIGPFKNRTEALKLLNTLKTYGWKQGFVAPNISVNQDESGNKKETLTPKIATDKPVINNSIDIKTDTFLNEYKPWYAFHTDKNEKGQIVYMVQIMASRKPVKINDYFTQLTAKITNLQIVETHQKDGWYRYYVGIYSTYTEANKKAHQIKAGGWNDFFIAPYITVK